jgi:hypothetical protein
MSMFARRIKHPGTITVLALYVVVLWGLPAHATNVTPNDAVIHYVNVRASASTQSAKRGKLAPGETAEETGSVPRWFKVKLANGVVGFVSKAWVTEVEGGSTAGGATAPTPISTPPGAPVPLLTTGHPVSWWLVFKLNAAVFPGCSGGATRRCPFGGQVQTYASAFSQQFVYATSDDPTLQQGSGCVGDSDADPVGATFGEIYNGSFHYVVWNDQFYQDPPITGCSDSCSAPWGHSKGMVAWSDSGDGLVIQVTTPSWPAAGSKNDPRQSDGNSLGCIKDNNIKFSQHFFALQLTHDDLLKVLTALQNASVVTDLTNAQIVSNGGPADVQVLVNKLGAQSSSTSLTKANLSSGVELISKPSELHVPPWQMVSAALGGVSLRVASWWSSSKIDSTTAATPIGCWQPGLGTPGAVEIATGGQWSGHVFGLKGGANHAKIGVSTAGTHHYAIFGDMNQEGALSGSAAECATHQNGRGGLFFVVENATLASSVSDLIKGTTSPVP